MELKKPQPYFTSSPMLSEIALRIIIWSSFIFMELLTPFTRVIQPEEMWMYRFPHTGFQYVPASILWMVSVIVPIMLLSIDCIHTRNHTFFRQGMLCLTLLLGLNGFITVLLKIIVGRPRPDFYYRCWPNGTVNFSMACTGERKSILEGRKSFPSGHASFSFASMMFLSLYLAGRLQSFGKHRGHAWRLVATLLPLIIALTIAVSRTCDYHHHWQDVVCGSLIGALLAYVCYYQYFPPTSTTHATIGVD